MSLDLYILSKKPITKTHKTGVYIRENGKTKELTLEEVEDKYGNWVKDFNGEY